MISFERVGSSGLYLPELTYGTALTLGTENSKSSFAGKMISTCWAAGIRSFDTSNNYGEGSAEELLGKVLQTYPREQYVLSTKGSWPIGTGPYDKGLNKKHLRHALENSLSRLKVDYIDIYYAHRFDPNVELEEIIRTFNLFIDQQKILYWATSEWPAEKIDQCIKLCAKLNLEPPICDQHILSYAVDKNLENDVSKICNKYTLGRLAYSPLCQGYLTGKYQAGIPNKSRISKANKINYSKTENFYKQFKCRIDHFNAMCNEFQIDNTAAALQWVRRAGAHIVIGASNIEQIEKNVSALDKKIPNEFWAKI